MLGLRLLIRCDGGPVIGGGHVMRCLTLAQAAAASGAAVAFVMAAGAMRDRVTAAGFASSAVPAATGPPDPDAPPHGHWLAAPWPDDAAATIAAAQVFAPDWLIWDHYGLDARWVRRVRAGLPALRVLALDDLDDRALGSDLVLDQTRLSPGPRSYPALAVLSGPRHALLRPGFALHRPAALARRGEAARRVLILPGLADAAGLAPLALRALARFPALGVDIAMGAASQSRAETAAMVANRPGATLHLDPPDMAALMARADLGIGAGGMAAWERCALGLPSVAIRVADNQRAALAGLERAGAAQVLSLAQAMQPGRLFAAIGRALAGLPAMAQAAAALCDGQGTARVLSALGGHLRPVTAADAQRLFDWRGSAAVRAASINQAPLDWSAHLAWLGRTLARRDGIWLIYSEANRPLGQINAVAEGAADWRWSFHLGEPDAPQGAGSRMCAAFLHRLMTTTDVARVLATVRADNPRSMRLHRALGFVATPGPDPGLLAFSWQRCNQGAAYGYDQIRPTPAAAKESPP